MDLQSSSCMFCSNTINKDSLTNIRNCPCHTAEYCDKRCQTKHWDTHKKVCWWSPLQEKIKNDSKQRIKQILKWNGCDEGEEKRELKREIDRMQLRIQVQKEQVGKMKIKMKFQKEEREVLHFLKTAHRFPSVVKGVEGRCNRFLRQAHKDGSINIDLKREIENIQLRIQVQEEQVQKMKIQKEEEELLRFLETNGQLPTSAGEQRFYKFLQRARKEGCTTVELERKIKNTQVQEKVQKEKKKIQKEEEELVDFLETNDRLPTSGGEGCLYRILQRVRKEGCINIDLKREIENMQLRIQVQEEQVKKVKIQKEEEELVDFLETNDQWPTYGGEQHFYRILLRVRKEGCATVELQTKIEKMQVQEKVQKEKKKKEKQEFLEETARITARVMSIPVNELPPFPSLANLCLNDTDDEEWLAASDVFDDMPSLLGTPPDWLSHGFKQLEEQQKK